MTTLALAVTPLPVEARPWAHGPSAGPIVKWVGGKGGLLPQLAPLLPPGVELMRHVEPFVGGGAVFFGLRPERALLCDVNPALVDTYAAVRDEVDAVIDQLRALAREHVRDERAYYRVRERYNRSQKLRSAQRAAMFVYLNKTCFNGLHRVNRRGEFNVPAGRYDKPRILNEEALRAASLELSRAELSCSGFERLLTAARPGDFVYLDPPYEPVSATASFTAYSQEGFGREDQLRLRDVFAVLDRRGCKLMLSNSDVPFIRDLYRRWNVSHVSAGRAVNSDPSRRGPVQEVVVRNY
jgi:DNA adenine methylase